MIQDFYNNFYRVLWLSLVCNIAVAHATSVMRAGTGKLAVAQSEFAAVNLVQETANFDEIWSANI